MISSDPSAFGDILFSFLSILCEGFPYILLGTVISGFIDAYLPSNIIDRVLPKRAGAAILLSGFLGALIPVCECAVVPVVRRLVQKGLPVSCAITYLLAAPVINPIVALSTYSAFQMQPEGFGSPVEYAGFMTVSRLLMAYLVAVFVGFVILRVPVSAVLRPGVLPGGGGSGVAGGAAGQAHADAHAHAHGAGGARLVQALRTAMRDFLDVAMYFTVGVAITSVFNTQFDQQAMEPLGENDLLAIPAMMGLAFVLSLCSTSDAFIMAPLTAFSHVSRLAFLVYGPMMDLKLMFMYTTVFRKAFVWKMVVGLFLLVGAVALAWSRSKGLLG